MKRLHSKIGIIFFCIFFSIMKMQAQHIEGNVYELDASGKKHSIPSVNLRWLGTKAGAVSDEDGKFHLDRPDTSGKNYLVVSFIGYKTDTILITNEKKIEIILNEAQLTTEILVVEVEKKGSYLSKYHVTNTEMIGSKELLRAACCNLSESFETNPSVDVNYADAITGAKQIRMLGLEGVYTQIMKENMPAFRGIANTYGLTYLPGSWIESIQVTKGAGSVINGYESMAGQINVELKRPLTSEPLLVNLYTDNMLRTELNINTTKKFSDNFGTTLLLHGDQNFMKVDRNNDGFLDVPLSKQFSFMNRWEYFDGKIRKFYLPLKQEGPVFQQDVWTELCNIPFGRTVAYIDIARKISNEKSVRAVGMTNGRNQIAIIVPCHRVISNKGDLTGYAGGIWRKKWLLEHEAKVAHGVQKLELV